MKRICLVGCLLVPALALPGQLTLKDSPARGGWHFNPEKIWEVERAGDHDFGRVGELLVSEHDYVCVRDFGRDISYVFDKDGTFVRAFAARGEGAGQLPLYLNRFHAGSKIVLAAPDRLHYFSEDGVFERASENDLFARFPLWFTSEGEFIYAPYLPQSPVHSTRLLAVDLASGQERLLLDFSEPGPEQDRSFRGPMLMIPSLTPQVKVACDGGRMVLGRNDRYKVFIAERTGSVRSTFSLDRRGAMVTLQDKQQLLAGAKLPVDQKEQIIATLPNEATRFYQLSLIDGCIWVFAVTEAKQKTRSQQIDIFSDSGTYLYRAALAFGDGLAFAGASDVVLKGRHAYVILGDGRGNRTLAKYRISLPR